ncbi:hypothetical protein [Aliikangiella sp. IMCC44632]
MSEETSESSSCTKINQVQSLLGADWNEYLSAIELLADSYQVNECLKLLNQADIILNQDKDVATSSETERLLIGGIADKAAQKAYPFVFTMLGDMTGLTSFKKVLKKDPAGLSKLLKIIPKTGPIDGWHFMQFSDSYKEWLNNNGIKQALLYPATRLLSMKRPDIFVSLNDESSPYICQALGIKPLKKNDLQAYWDTVLNKIHQAKWFKIDQPMQPEQIPFYRGRVALLERFAVAPAASTLVEQALNSTSVAAETADGSIDHAHQTTANNSPLTNPQDAVSNLGYTSPLKEVSPPKKAAAKQPKKLKIAKLKTEKGSIAAATKLMSQYYFANKAQFAKVDVKKHRDEIIERIAAGEAADEVFNSYC